MRQLLLMFNQNLLSSNQQVLKKRSSDMDQRDDLNEEKLVSVIRCESDQFRQVYNMEARNNIKLAFIRAELGRMKLIRSTYHIVVINICLLTLMNLGQFIIMASTSTATNGSLRKQQSTPKQLAVAAPINQQKSLSLTATSNASEQTSALIYLQRYGYMQASANNGETNNLVSEESFSSAIADFQRFAGLPQTGIADAKTLELMRLPRCGNSDKWRQNAANPDSTIVSKFGQLTNAKLELENQSLIATNIKRRRRKKRYALQGSKWRRQELTYRISQYPSRFSGKRHEVDSQIEKAFGIWSQVAPIDFVVKKEGRVHIDIRFASGDHGDGDAFDGPGNTLAHAYFPQYGGDAHFDDQEYWTIDSYAGTNIFQVAAHELGHSLGLGHSNVREALMAPFYQKYKPHFKLHLDDVLAIQALYGEKPFELPPPPTSAVSSTTTTIQPPSTTTWNQAPVRPTVFNPSIYKGTGRPKTKSTTSTASPKVEDSTRRDRDEHENDIPDLTGNGLEPDQDSAASGPGSSHAPGGLFPADLCTDSAIDAITRTEDGNTYAFKGDFYWQLVNEGIAKGYPRRISTDWDGLPGHLDAAITWADGKTFFFKGNKYWRFKNKRRDVGYPKLISAGFAGVPDDLDAAFVWSGNGRTYFFKGAEYWRFDSKADPPVSSEYPRSVKVWLGVPAYLNAAFKWENNVTYFFKGNQYYRFNDKEFRVESRGSPPFPRQTSEWWFGCVNSNLAQRALSGSLIRQQQNLDNAAETQTPKQTMATTTNGNNEWSFLAGLNDDSTKPHGTHISDHHKPPVVAPIPSSLPDSGELETSQLDEPQLGGEPHASDQQPALSRRLGMNWNGGNSVPFRLNSFLDPHPSSNNAFKRPASSSSSSASSSLSAILQNYLIKLEVSLITLTVIYLSLPFNIRRQHYTLSSNLI